jgi:hypothetical protein
LHYSHNVGSLSLREIPEVRFKLSAGAVASVVVILCFFVTPSLQEDGRKDASAAASAPMQTSRIGIFAVLGKYAAAMFFHGLLKDAV